MNSAVCRSASIRSSSGIPAQDKSKPRRLDLVRTRHETIECSANSWPTRQTLRLRRKQMSTYFFIKSKLDGNVIDIQNIKGDDTTSGALLDAYPQKTTGTDNQLWEFVPDPAGSGYYFIKSKLDGNVIDIQRASFQNKAPL